MLLHYSNGNTRTIITHVLQHYINIYQYCKTQNCSSVQVTGYLVCYVREMVVVYLSLRWRKLLLSSGCSSSKLKLDQLPRLSSPTLSCWDTEDSVASLPGKLNPQRDEKGKGFKMHAKIYKFLVNW